MALVGYGVLVGIPVISTAWVNLLGFSAVEVGRVAGADLGGLSLGAILTALLIAKVNRRYLVHFAVYELIFAVQTRTVSSKPPWNGTVIVRNRLLGSFTNEK